VNFRRVQLEAQIRRNPFPTALRASLTARNKLYPTGTGMPEQQHQQKNKTTAPSYDDDDDVSVIHLINQLLYFYFYLNFNLRHIFAFLVQ
jgi:hypothetical protein